VEGIVGLPQQLNPLLSDDNPVDREVVALVFDGLTRRDAEGNLVPALAESWSVAEDGLSVTFQLRDDVTWQDGEPFTARDVAFTYGLLQDESFPAPAGLRLLWQNVTIQILSDTELLFTLPTPYPPFLDATTRGILPAHLLADVDPAALAEHSFNQAPVGTGPFRVDSDSWTRTGRLRLLPNQSWWQRGIQIDAVEYRFFPDSEAVDAAFASGEIQAINQVDPTLLPEVAALPQARLYTAPVERMTQLLFNLGGIGDTTGLPLADRPVREALAYGLDKKALLDTAINGQGIPLDGPYLPSSWAYDASVVGYPTDVLSATQLLEDAGWTLPQGERIRQNAEGEPLILTVLLPDRGPAQALADGLALQWAQLGVGLESQRLPAAEYRAALADGAFDIALVVISPSGDPDLYDFWSQEAILRGQNYGGWNNRRASEALETARQTWDRETRLAEYRGFLRQFAADVPALTLYQHVATYALSDAVNEADIGRIDAPRERYETLPQWFLLFRNVTVLCPEVQPGPAS
jgi:peptide/nickel transport system substrate-binding protein